MNNNKDFDLDIPYFVPCTYPLISSFIKRKSLNISTALLANTALLGLPTFYALKNEFNPNVDITVVDKLGYNLVANKLGITGTMREIGEFNKKHYLKQYIKEHGIAIVSGTTYYLPYSKDYLNASYYSEFGRYIGVVDHWLCVYEMGFRNIKVYDPVPNKFNGTINKAQFMSFWKGDREIEQLKHVKGIENLHKNGLLDISIKQILKPEEIDSFTRKLLHILKFEYFNDKTINEGDRSYYYGKQAIEQIKEIYLGLLNRDVDKEHTQKVWKCFFDIKFSLLFIQYLVNELGDFYESAIYSDIKEKLDTCIDTWGTIDRLVNANMLRGNSIDTVKDIVTPKINYAIEVENKVYDLLDCLKE